MKYRQLGRTGISVSEIGFGTWGIGGVVYGKTSDWESLRALKTSLDQGINFYDTADLYGNGHSEELLGKAFSGKRDKVIIATKGGTLPHNRFEMPQDFSSKYIRTAIEGSLRRLKTDYIDVYLLHSPKIGDIQGNGDLLNTLETSKKEGKIRAFGLSSRSPEDAVRGIDKYDFNIVEVNFNLIDQRALENGLFERAERDTLGLIIRTPLTFGYLAGKLCGDEKFDPRDHRTNWPKEQLKRWAHANQLFSFLFEKKNRTPAQVAIRFCLDYEAVTTVIPGMMKASEVLENSATSDLPPLTDEEISRVEYIYKTNEFYDKSAKQ